MIQYDDESNKMFLNVTKEGVAPTITADLGHVSKYHVVDYEDRFGIVGVVEIENTTKYMIHSDDNAVAPTIRASYFKAGVANFIYREDGYKEPAILEIIES